MTSYPFSLPGTGQVVTLPSWSAQWRAAKAAVQAGTGTAKIVCIGDSWTAGQSSGTITDCLTYGWVGRLDTLLAGKLGGYAEGYVLGGATGPTGPLTEPSSPYGNISGLSSYSTFDGGIGQLFNPVATGTTWLTISAPVHPVTGASPVSMDVLTVDYLASGTGWGYKVDGGSTVNVTMAGAGTLSGAVLRRTSISFAGNTTHTVAISQAITNGLYFAGHVTYYGTTGVGIMRSGLPGWRAVDYATGSGTAAGSNGAASLMPDHIEAWSGVASANNTAGSGFPFNADLGIIWIGGNDCGYGMMLSAFRASVTRMINALRRANPATPTTTGAQGTSILIIGHPFSSPYSDNSSSGNFAPVSVGGINWNWQAYKTVLYDLALEYGCGWIDMQGVFGETPVAQGLFSAAGQSHPTQNGTGTGGGDGHLLAATTINGML